MAYKIAADNLLTGTSVVADSCNPVSMTRKDWEDTAVKTGSDFINIEIICSDKSEHKFRVETRKSDIPGLKLPLCDEVENREYQEWKTKRIVIDTSGKKPEESFEELILKINTGKFTL